MLREQKEEISSYMEQQDAVMTYLEHLNQQNQNEVLFKRMCRKAIATCLEFIHEHCNEFIKTKGGDASYEAWIQEFHPECIGSKSGCLDHRFYVRDSDHRIIWNGYCDMYGYPERKIQYIHSCEDEKSIDGDAY